ncbi:MAG: flagellar basal body rod C-terminal domain-containing protein [Gemmatimonadaceae bacterium]
MITGFISRVTPAGELKEALDVGTQRVRAIADRVSKASLLNQDGFALPGSAAGANGAAAGATSGVDIETEMVNLADEQLRYEATSKLLAKAYDQVRTALKP